MQEEKSASDDEECLSETPFEAAMEVLDEEAPESGWTTVGRKGRRSDEELAQEFSNEIGFPMTASNPPDFMIALNSVCQSKALMRYCSSASNSLSCWPS